MNKKFHKFSVRTLLSASIVALGLLGPIAASAETINVIKTVINDNGGTKQASDFSLFVNGTPVVSGVATPFPTPVSDYAVTETTDARYKQSFSGDCDFSGHLSLATGENKFCIVTNDDIGPASSAPPVPPLIDVIKVPSVLSLPNGPGPVTYTYTLRNVGVVPVNNIQMLGDTCLPLTLTSGDDNSNAILDVNETWIYQCTTVLTQTYTNAVVAAGTANGITTVDIASVKVVVASPATPPLIHVSKIPSPTTLPMGGGMVTSILQITNPGTMALGNIRLSDDMCAPMYVSGDINNDSMLDPSENWNYACESNQNKTITSVAVATGDASGLSARDFAIATVVVAAAPGLPNTGISPEMKSTLGNIIILSLVMSLIILLVVVVRERLV